MENTTNTETKTARTIKIGETVYEYVKTVYNPYTCSNEYMIRSQGYPTNGANRGQLYICVQWAKREDLYSVRAAGDRDSHLDATLWMNPTTKKLEDATHRITDSYIASRPDANFPDGVCYWRTPTLFDGAEV